MHGATRSSAIRIGYCIDSFNVGGTELNAVRTLEALDLNSFCVTVFHFHEDGPIRSRYEQLGVELIHVPISSLYRATTLAQGVRFASSLRRRKIEIVHTHDLYTNIFGTPFARVLGRCRTIASRRWLYEAPRPLLTRVNRWSYGFATRVLADSAAVSDILRIEGVPGSEIVELPNFLEEGAFGEIDGRAREAQRRMWGLPEQAFVVGLVARLVPVKDHVTMLRALTMLDDAVHVVLIGDGPEREPLESLARELGVRARVHFSGQLISRGNLHCYFDVSVLCSRSEGFPNSVIEAMAAARPIVATPVGGVKDVVEDNISGLLVPVADPQALANRITLLKSTPDLRLRLGAAGLARVRTKYHQSVVISQLSALYRKLARRASEPGSLNT